MILLLLGRFINPEIEKDEFVNPPPVSPSFARRRGKKEEEGLTPLLDILTLERLQPFEGRITVHREGVVTPSRWFSAQMSASTKCWLSFSYLLVTLPLRVMVSPT